VLSGKPLDRSAVLGIIERRCRNVGLPAAIGNHSFRATGITLHQENGGDMRDFTAGRGRPFEAPRRSSARFPPERLSLVLFV
jgi:hypothetical protein